MQNAAITLADGQATPVNKTFAVAGVTNGVASWEERSGGIPIGYSRLSTSLRRPAKGSRNFKVVTKVQLPVLEVTSPSTATGIQPAPTKAYELFATMEFTIPERASAADRANLLAYAKNALANSLISAEVKDLDNIW